MATNNAINEYNPQASFFAYLSAATGPVTGDNTIVTVPFDSEIYDLDSNFNTGTYTFTAPFTGKYYFQANLLLENIAAQGVAGITILTTTRTYNSNLINPGAAKNATNQCSLNIAIVADMTATDTAYVTVVVGNAAKTVSLGMVSIAQPDSWFTGYLIR